MKKILITGASGFLGTALTEKLLARGHKVYALSRHPPEPKDNLVPLKGDILEPNLGLTEVPDIDCCHHLAALHQLGDDKDGSIWRTNVDGTANVLEFCAKYNIPHLYFCSTAYTQGRNVYERSKALCEAMVNESHIPRTTIFKPSIILGTPQHFYPGHISQFIALVVKLHQRAEVIRLKIEGGLRLPVLEPVFRFSANAEGKIDIVSIDAVAKALVDFQDSGSIGTYWLTHPEPLSLKQLAEWISEFIMVRMVIEPKFEPTPIEAMFQKMSAAFIPYLWGDNFFSDMHYCPPITKELIFDNIKRTILG